MDNLIEVSGARAVLLFWLLHAIVRPCVDDSAPKNIKDRLAVVNHAGGTSVCQMDPIAPVT